MKITTPAKLVLALVIVALLVGLVALVLELLDWRPESSGPEYVPIRWIIIIPPPQKPWFPWLHK